MKLKQGTLVYCCYSDAQFIVIDILLDKCVLLCLEPSVNSCGILANKNQIVSVELSKNRQLQRLPAKKTKFYETPGRAMYNKTDKIVLITTGNSDGILFEAHNISTKKVAWYHISDKYKDITFALSYVIHTIL